MYKGDNKIKQLWCDLRKMLVPSFDDFSNVYGPVGHIIIWSL